MAEDSTLTGLVIGAAIEVHRELGPGLLESCYQRCMEIELQNRGIAFESLARLPLAYKGQVVDDTFIMDFYFPHQLVVELKAVEKVLPVHEAQLLTYLRLSKTRLGLLLNFNVPVLKDGIIRRML